MQMRAGAYEIPCPAVSRTLGGSLLHRDVLLQHTSRGVSKQPGLGARRALHTPPATAEARRCSGRTGAGLAMGSTPVASGHWLPWGKELVGGGGVPGPCSSEGGGISHFLLASQAATAAPHLHGHPLPPEWSHTTSTPLISCHGGPLTPCGHYVSPLPFISCHGHHPSTVMPPLMISTHSHPHLIESMQVGKDL